MTEPRDLHMVIACSYGCCPGCQDCYGYSIGCHQEPCRCDKPCTCRYVDEDSDRRWRDGCERHDAVNDRRRPGTYDDDPPDLTPDEFGPANPCPICGSLVECGVDTEGRPWVHVETAEADRG